MTHSFRVAQSNSVTRPAPVKDQVEEMTAQGSGKRTDGSNTVMLPQKRRTWENPRCEWFPKPAKRLSALFISGCHPLDL